MSWRCGTGRANATPTSGSPSSWPTCAPHFDGPPTTTTSTRRLPSPCYAAFLGFWVEQYEPVAWAEELIEPAKAIEHRRLPQLYVMAAHVLCDRTGRRLRRLCRQPARRPSKADVSTRSRTSSRSALGGTYATAGEPERWVEWCRTVIAREPGTHALARAFLVLALTVAGAHDEAIATVSEDLLAAVDATDNPAMLGRYALLAYGVAHRDADPVARVRRAPPGPDDRSRQRQPTDRVAPCRQPVTACRYPRRSDGCLRLPDPGDSPLTTTRQLLPTCAARWQSSPPSSTGSDTTNPPPP